MYIPKYFEITDAETISNFIQSNSFGQLISLHDGALVASHLPFIHVEKESRLIGHLSRANPQWQQIQGQRVLVTLQGEHAYVSPSWYESEGVPTWNYQAVHIEGIAQTFTDVQKLKHVVDSLTDQHESAYPEPWQADYPAEKLRGIVGIEIAISSIQCAFKASQNRSETDRKNVRRQLEIAGHEALAGAMTDKQT